MVIIYSLYLYFFGLSLCHTSKALTIRIRKEAPIGSFNQTFDY